MRVYLLRHGRTAYNDQRRYQGSSDVPLSPAGEAELAPAGFEAQAVYVSPMRRAEQTAARLFPGARQVVVDAFREMDFGAFEGRNFQEMERDADYRAWVDGGCMGRCPGGESRTEFTARVVPAFAALVEAMLEQRRERVAVVAHGGVQMAAMERFALPQRTYFAWNAPCGGGFVLETDRAFWRRYGKLRLAETVCYTKGGGIC